MILGEQAMAFDHHDVQAIVGVAQQLGVLAVEQVGEHLPAAGADLGPVAVFAEVLVVVQLAKATNAGGSIGQAGTGKAPGANGCTDQGAFTGRTGQPVAKQRQVQALNTQGLRPAGGAGQNPDIGGRQAIGLDPRQGAGAGLDGQGRGFDLYAVHAALPYHWPRL